MVNQQTTPRKCEYVKWQQHPLQVISTGSTYTFDTTVRRVLIILKNGAMLIDNPGMREFGILGAKEGMSDSFADIYELASKCKLSQPRKIRELRVNIKPSFRFPDGAAGLI